MTKKRDKGHAIRTLLTLLFSVAMGYLYGDKRFGPGLSRGNGFLLDL